MITRSGIRIDDCQWKNIERLLPRENQVGRPRSDDRTALKGILYVLKHGCRWQDVPPEYGSPVTAWRRFRHWRKTGLWEEIWETLLRGFDEEEQKEWADAFLHGSCIPIKKREKLIERC